MGEHSRPPQRALSGGIALVLVCLALAGCGPAPADGASSSGVAASTGNGGAVMPASTDPPAATATATATATRTATRTATPTVTATATRTATPIRLDLYPSRGWVAEAYYREVPDGFADWDTQASNAWMSGFYDRIGYTPPLLEALRAQDGTPATPAPIVGEVDCAALTDDRLLTSPVRSAERMAAVSLRYPLGWVSMSQLGDIDGTAFQLQPGTEIYAPISGRLEQNICYSWEDTVYSVLTIYSGDTQVGLVLPVYYYPRLMPADEEIYYRHDLDVCLDCVDLIGLVESETTVQREGGGFTTTITVGRDWVERGDLLAVYHSGSLPLGGFSANFVVGMVRPNEGEQMSVVPLLPLSDIWATGSPAFCTP